MRGNAEIIKILKKGGVGVFPTDTIYGLVGSALSKTAIERIYRLKKRSPKKPMIILIGSKRNLKLFKIKLSRETEKLLKKNWPGKVIVILPCPLRKFFYLHRGTKKLAFRLPKKEWLRSLLKKTGPLAAPSANPESLPPAETIKKAKEYFAGDVDFYTGGGKLTSLPSTLIEIEKEKITIKRKGAAKINF